jgi:hypothetical protein
MKIRTICEQFICPDLKGCNAYRGKPCTFENARDTCGEATCLRCTKTETCEVIFGKYPTSTDIHRLVCNPGHTQGCKDKGTSCGYYPPFRFAFCKTFEKNCKERFKPEPAVTEDGQPALKFVTFVIPKKAIDDYVASLHIRLRKLQREGLIRNPLQRIIDKDREVHNLHNTIMTYFPGYSGDVSVVPSAFRYAVEGYVEDELRKFGCIA